MVWAGTLVLVHSIASDDEASPVVFDRHRAFVIMEPVREWRVSGSVSEANAKAAAPSERKLTSIVVADVVGYSRLTAADEDGTLARLRELRSDRLKPRCRPGTCCDDLRRRQ